MVLHLAATGALADTVRSHDSGANPIHRYGFQPQSCPHIRAKITPAAAEWVPGSEKSNQRSTKGALGLVFGVLCVQILHHMSPQSQLREASRRLMKGSCSAVWMGAVLGDAGEGRALQAAAPVEGSWFTGVPG